MTYRVVLLGCGTLEVVWTMPVFALLFTESFQNLTDGLLPQVAKNAVVASYLPVIIGQSQGIAQ